MEKPTAPRFVDPFDRAAGRFATMINIGHTPEFFALDFHSLTPEGDACLLGRFFVTPAHAKRLMEALRENVASYEAQHGEVNTAKELKKN